MIFKFFKAYEAAFMAAFLLLGTLVLKVISSEKEIRCCCLVSDKSSTKLDYKILENRVANQPLQPVYISSVDTIAEQ